MIISFTGHRPDRLGTGYSITNDRVRAYGDLLHNTLVPLINDEGADRFISGGAIGIDQIAFWTIQGLKKDFPHIKNVIAIPFEKQYMAWKNNELVSWYHKMVSCADEVVYVDTLEQYSSQYMVAGEYAATKLNLRNHYMVDHSDKVVAVLADGATGGTANCVKYALQHNKPVICLQPLTF